MTKESKVFRSLYLEAMDGRGTQWELNFLENYVMVIVVIEPSVSSIAFLLTFLVYLKSIFHNNHIFLFFVACSRIKKKEPW